MFQIQSLPLEKKSLQSQRQSAEGDEQKFVFPHEEYGNSV